MSKNRNRAKLNKALINIEYKILFLKELYPPYYEEGWIWKNPNLPNHKGREYKTWKHNRKTQYKIRQHI